MNAKTSVLIAEDEPLAAEALAEWVQQTPQLQLVAACADGETALARIRALRRLLHPLGQRLRGERLVFGDQHGRLRSHRGIQRSTRKPAPGAVCTRSRARPS